MSSSFSAAALAKLNTFQLFLRQDESMNSLGAVVGIEGLLRRSKKYCCMLGVQFDDMV
jgi:hypothetical protein